MQPSRKISPHSLKSTFYEEDLTDDAVGITQAIGLRTSSTLQDRFISRLSKMTGASVRLKVDPNHTTVDIQLARNRGNPHCRIELDTHLKEFLTTMKLSLSTISRHEAGPQHDFCKDELWDAVLHYAHLNVDHIIHGIKRAFEDGHETFAKFFSRYLGLDAIDEHAAAIDEELAAHLVALHQKIHAYNQSPCALNELINFASSITRTVDHLQERQRYLLGEAQFANKLYQLICTLGFPERAYSTFVRQACTSPAFKNIAVTLRETAPSPIRVHSATSASGKTAITTTTFSEPIKKSSMPSVSGTKRPSKNITKPSHSVTDTNFITKVSHTPTVHTMTRLPAACSVQLTEASKTLSTPELEATYRQMEGPAHINAASDSTIASSDQLDIIATIRPFLAKEDERISLSPLEPVSKRHAAQLLGAVLRGKLLPTSSDAWFSFGFVTAREENTERRLGGLYAAILKEASNPCVIFCELTRALETNTIVDLFDVKDYSHFRELFPGLEAFLRAPPRTRSTVWVLIQYLRLDTYMDPAPVLKRDFGYQFCKNHNEVTVLNDIYRRFLAKCTAEVLHDACVHGRITEVAQRHGVHIEPQHQRFLVNQNGNDAIGFDNDEGLERHRLPLFKRQKL